MGWSCERLSRTISHQLVELLTLSAINRCQYISCQLVNLSAGVIRCQWISCASRSSMSSRSGNSSKSSSSATSRPLQSKLRSRLASDAALQRWDKVKSKNEAATLTMAPLSSSVSGQPQQARVARGEGDASRRDIPTWSWWHWQSSLMWSWRWRLIYTWWQ